MLQTAEIAKLNTEDIRAYELSVNAYRDIKNGIDTAKKEGRKEGRKEGIAIGSKNKAWEIAKNMIAEGMTYPTIAKLTGLSIDEIEEIDKK